MDEGNENIDMTEVKRTLEDVGLFEPNLPDDVLVSYYKAIRNSESTASRENESRQLNKSQEELIKCLDESLERDMANSNTSFKDNDKPFTPKVWTSEKKLSQNKVPEHNNNHNVQKDDIDEGISKFKDATKMVFGFNDMAENSEHTLNIITHEPQFVPIHNTQDYLNAGTALKAKMLYAYHTRMNKVQGQLARMSFYPAPLPNVTSTTDIFPDFSDVDVQETYICRSGRQTKRKVYNYDEDEDNLDSGSYKKSKNVEEVWLRKPVSNNTSIRTNKKLESQVSIEVEGTNSITTEGSNENTKPASKLEKRTTPRKLQNNTEIMKRSSLFAESPKTRCESMFDNLKKIEEKKSREEKTMQMFNATLDHDSIDINEDIISVDDDVPVRRRVSPPIPAKIPSVLARRAINNRKRNKSDGVAPLDIAVNSPTQKREDTVNHNVNSQFKEPTIENVTKKPIKKRVGIRKGTTNAVTDPQPSTSKTPKAESNSDDVACPICSGSFHKDEIQEHASSCGEEMVTRSSSKISRITCEICDKVVGFDTSYEVHVKDCINKKNNS